MSCVSLGEARVPPVPGRSSQCAAVCMACADTGPSGMEAACALLGTLDPTVTKVSRAAGTAWERGRLGDRCSLNLSGNSFCTLISFSVGEAHSWSGGEGGLS